MLHFLLRVVSALTGVMISARAPASWRQGERLIFIEGSGPLD
jgi:hypothetical protein